MSGEERWSADAGAIFLANLDDDERRCPKTGRTSSCPRAMTPRTRRSNGAAGFLCWTSRRLEIAGWPLAPDGTTGPALHLPAAGRGSSCAGAAGADAARGTVDAASGVARVRPRVDALSAQELREGVALWAGGRRTSSGTARSGTACVTVTLTVTTPRADGHAGTPARLGRRREVRGARVPPTRSPCASRR